MVSVLTGDTGDDFLKKVTTYEWDDDGLSKVPAAQLNPLLMRSYASALVPHLDEQVGKKQDAFDSLRARSADEPLALRNVLSVFVADPESGRTIVEAAHTADEHYEEAAAAAPPGSDESVTHLTAAGCINSGSGGSQRGEGHQVRAGRQVAVTGRRREQVLERRDAYILSRSAGLHIRQGLRQGD
jgi:hypothetical protein